MEVWVQGAKSIVQIKFTDKQPRTLWNDSAPNEYGFYANVNPQVDHPRWSQAHERADRYGGVSALDPDADVQRVRGPVASMYGGMDLRKNF